MSKQVDERVVSMQFDNKNFEKNVSQSMSTLDKFKQKLHLKGASKGLDEVNTAAKKVDMNGLASGVETVRMKFSALEVMGVTALANITNSAVNAGKRMVSALTIDPIKTGLSEYETQINSVQTILANTQSKGSTLDDVNQALDELNKYADKTIYNFTEMTRNIGTFTAAGVELDTSVNAIKGIANLAAVSGSTSQQASTAMYQLSQAMASGSVKLMDWNSVVNAGMGGQVFQDALKETARVHGIAIDSMIESEGSFRETLKSGWLTTEILTDTLQKFTLTTEGLTEEQIAANREMLKAKGYTEQQIDEIFKLGNTATDAATKVKTFTQLWDVLKEAAQSGWAQTWKLIIGDYEEAKSLLSPLAEFLTNLINKMSDFRNKVVDSALSKNFKHISESIKGMMKPITATTETVKEMVDTVTDYSKVVDEIIAGKWGNAPTRWQELTAAGYDWAHAQNLVNERLGSGVRHATNYTEAQKQQTKATKDLNAADAKTIEHLIGLTDAQLKSKGYTQEQIDALRELEKISNKLGIPIRELIKNIDEINGRWLLMKGFENIGKSLLKVFGAIKDAFVEAFNITEEGTANTLFDLIAGFHRLSTKLIMSDDTAKDLKDTFKGLFSIIKIVFTIVGGPVKIAFKLLGAILKACGTSVLELTGGVGRAISAFSDWLDKTLDFSGIAEKLAPHIKNAAKATKQWFISLKDSAVVKAVAEYLVIAKNALVNWFQSFKSSKYLESFVDLLKSTAKAISKWFEGLKESDNIGVYIAQGLIRGIGATIKMVWQVATELGKAVINAVKDILGIHSPSKVFFAIGGFIVAGLINGIKNMSPQAIDSIGGLFGDILKFIQGINFNEIFSAFLTSGFTVSLINASTAFKNFSETAKGLGDMLSDVGEGVKKTLFGFSKTLSGLGASLKAKAIKDIAIAIAVLVGAIFLMTLIDTGKAVAAVAMVGGLIAAMVILANSLGKIDPKQAVEFGKAALSILGIAGALLILAIAMRIMGGMDWNQLLVAGAGIAMLGVVMKMLIKSTKQAGNEKDIVRVSMFVTKLGTCLLLMAVALKILGTMEWDELGRAGAAIGGLSLLVGILIGITKFGKKRIDQTADFVKSLGACLLMMAISVRLLGGMEWGELAKAGVGMLGLSILVTGLIAATKLAGSDANLDKTAKLLTAVGVCILIMSASAKILATMDWGELAKAGVGLAGLAIIVAGLIAATKLAGGNDLTKVGTTLIMISGAIAILSIVVAVMSFIPAEGLAKGVIVVGLLSLFVAGLIKATKDATQCTGPLIALSIAVGILAAAVIILSYIDPAKLIAPTLAIVALMYMFKVLIQATKEAEKCIGPVIIMTAAIAVLAGAIYLLAKLPVDNVLASALGLSALMIALSVSLKLLKSVGKSAKEAFVGVGALATLAVALFIFVGVLATMQNVKNVLPNVMALIAITTAMTLLLIPLSLVGALGMSGLPFIGVGALATLAVALFAFVGVLATMQNVKNAMPNALALCELATVMTWLLIPLSAVGALGLLGLPFIGAGALATMAVPLIAFVGILAAMQGIQNATENANVLCKLMTVMTAVLLVISLAAPLMVAAPSAMTSMIIAITAVGAFVVAVGILAKKCKSLEGSIDAGFAILEKIATGLGAVLGKFIAGFAVSVMSSLPIMGMMLSLFMINATPFIEGMKNIDAAALEGVKTLVKMILLLTAADIIQGLTSWLTGGSSLTQFGSEIAGFGPSLKKFADSVAGIDAESVKAAAEAAKALAEMTSCIPNEGGVAAWFAGENSITKFADEIPELGEALVEFSNSAAGINAESVTAAAEAAKALAEMTATIPDAGGVASWFAGENSVSKFADELPELGEGLLAFSNSVSGINAEAISAAAKAGKGITELTQNIPNSGGVASWFAGDNSVSKFAGELGKLGTGISTFSTNVGKTSVDNINKAVKAAEGLSKMLSTKVASNPKTLGDLGKKLVDFAGSFSKFSSAMGKIKNDSITSAVDKVKKLASMAKSITADSIDNLKNFSKTLADVGKKGVKEFTKALNSKDVKGDAKKAINDLVKSVASAIKTDENKKKFKSAGKYLMEGLAEGIKANKKTVLTEAQAVADAVEKKIRAAWKVNSPSKVFYGIALGIGEGIEYALHDSTAGVSNSARDLADTTSKGFGNAISKIYDTVNTNMDMQPTIRPVLDLSDVKSGANSIAGMFGGRTLSVSAPGIGAITASMSNRQNGNNDLASAINKLAKSNGKTGDTYNINGISYNGESDVAGAIQTLVRAAKMEGRT